MLLTRTEYNVAGDRLMYRCLQRQETRCRATVSMQMDTRERRVGLKRHICRDDN